jgi:enoyl-CoA hydratase/carnithine racemase
MSSATSFADGAVLIERDDVRATVVLNRPEKLNALTLAMWRGVGEAFRALDGDESVRCIVLRGAGEKAVGPGADITEFGIARADSMQAAAYGAIMHGSMRAIRECRHPVIARIQGLCVGGALELALMCDLRISGDTARFGVPINRLGLVMAHAEIEALVGLVGPSVALEILYEARVFGAEEALAKRLVNRVVPAAELDNEIAAAVARIAAGAPLVNRWHKKFVWRVATDPAPIAENEACEGFSCFDTEDYKEGVRAFLAKQTPKFEGH